jgi:hypothetical protein
MQPGLGRRLEISRHPRSRCHPAWRVGIGGGRASPHRDAQGQPILSQPCSREPRTSAEPSTIHQAEDMLVLEGRRQDMSIRMLQVADGRCLRFMRVGQFAYVPSSHVSPAAQASPEHHLTVSANHSPPYSPVCYKHFRGTDCTKKNASLIRAACFLRYQAASLSLAMD